MSGFDFWFGLISFLAGIAVWAWDDRILLNSYRCPQCGTHLSPSMNPSPNEGDPVTFICEACDIEWDTTLRT